MKGIYLAGALLLAAAAQPAAAQQPAAAPTGPGWGMEGFRPYLALQGAFVMPRDRSTTDGTRIEFDDGWAGRLALGSRFGMLRGEVEGGFSRYNVDRLTDPPISEAASGRIETWTLMANAYVDIDLGWPVVPYVGAGAGVAHIRARDVDAPIFFSRTDDNDNVVAYQAMAGVAFQVAPAIDLTAGYRFFETRRPSFTTDAGGSYRINRPRTHNIEAGLRMQF